MHQALDQTGAMLGPLLLAAVLAWNGGDYRLAFGVLIVPGILVLALLFWLRHRVPDPIVYEQPEDERNIGNGEAEEATTGASTRRLPARFWQYVAAVAVLSLGVAPFPLLAFHAQTHGLLSDALVPVVFAVAMATDGLSGLLVGRLYDRYGPLVLLTVPVTAGIAAIAFGGSTLLIWIGVAVWGLVNGVLDSTVKAVVTELVSRTSRAIAFGWLAFVRGCSLLVAGATLGAAYGASITLAITIVIAANIIGFVGLLLVLRRLPHDTSGR